MAKLEQGLIERLNKAIENAGKHGMFHVGITLIKSRNSWTFSGHPLLVEALASHSDVILPTLEATALNIKETVNEMVELGETSYQTQLVLPPLPAPLTKISLAAARSYIANCLSVITGIRDCRLVYKQPRPEWWPAEIPFEKPGTTPQSIMAQYGSGASAQWHLRLRTIIYMMHGHTNQDFRKNVDSEGWRSFLNK